MAIPQKIPLLQRSASVLVPVFNEQDNIEPTVTRLLDALTFTMEDFEIIIVDDGSTDDTLHVAKRLAEGNPNVRVLSNGRNMGLGFAYNRACEEAAKEYFVYIPGDNTWPYRSFVELFGNMGRADIITSYAINPEVRPFSRRIVSSAFTLLMNRLFGRRMRYFNGLTIYPISFLRRRPATTFGFGFQAEVLLKALFSGLSYIEVGLPIDERAAGGSKAVNLRNIVSVIATVLRLFYDLRIRGNWNPTQTKAERRLGGLSQAPLASLDELGFDPAKEGEEAIPVDGAASARVIVITGGSTGIGAALAKDLAQAGHRIFVCSRSADRLTAAFADVANVKYAACDVTSESDLRSFVTFVSGQADRVDVLINCAGSFGAIGSIDKVDAKQWIDTVSGNVLGTFLPSKEFLPLLRRSDSAQIINFSGGGAFNPFPNFSAYACAKAAIVRLTETMATELAPQGIVVNAVAPGVILTEAHKATIIAGPELAGAVQYRRAERLVAEGSNGAGAGRMETVQRCVRALISPAYRGLTGKTISANFDPWMTEAFRDHIVDIARSELYTMRRANMVSLPDGMLKSELERTWARHRTQS